VHRVPHVACDKGLGTLALAKGRSPDLHGQTPIIDALQQAWAYNAALAEGCSSWEILQHSCMKAPGFVGGMYDQLMKPCGWNHVNTSLTSQHGEPRCPQTARVHS
jgi:hypothetical protein